MVKTILHTLIILLVSGLVAGGIYLFVQNSGTTLIGGGPGQAERFSRGQGNGSLPQGDFQPEALNFNPGQRPGSGDRDGGGGGFSLAGLSGVLMQAAKVAVITVFVVLMRAVIRLFKRRRKVVSPAAA